MSDDNKIWFNGELREHADCMVHVQSHALHYGSSVFEGIRAYDTPGGTKIFRLHGPPEEAPVFGGRVPSFPCPGQ